MACIYLYTPQLRNCFLSRHFFFISQKNCPCFLLTNIHSPSDPSSCRIFICLNGVESSWIFYKEGTIDIVPAFSQTKSSISADFGRLGLMAQWSQVFDFFDEEIFQVLVGNWFLVALKTKASRIAFLRFPRFALATFEMLTKGKVQKRLWS